jgi:ATP-binding cassette subfamily C protein
MNAAPLPPGGEKLWQAMPRLAGWPRLAMLAALTVLLGLTEGAGLILLVPLAARIEPGAANLDDGHMLSDQFAALSLPMILALLVGVLGLRALLQHRLAMAQLRAEIAIVDTLRAEAFSTLLNAEWRAISAMRLSDTRALLISSIDRVGHAAERGIAAVGIAANGVILAGTALLLSPVLALVICWAGGAALLLYRGLRRRAGRLGEELGRAYEDIYAQLEEDLGALRVIKSYGREAQARADLASGFARLRRTQLSFLRDTGRARIVLHMAGAGLLAATIWFALSRGSISPALLAPFAAIGLRAIPQIGAFQETWQAWLHSAPAFADVSRLSHLASVQGETEETEVEHRPPPVLKREIVLDDVRYTHRADRPALRGISLNVPAGCFVAITGLSGAGKSTLADILAGLLAPDGGTMRIDDEVLKGARFRDWRQACVYIQQKPVLFGGSVRENLLFGVPDADEDAMRTALSQAKADFEHDLPGGLDCDLGEAGRALSGGEKQRIALARGLLRQPQLLILDEATSSVDRATEDAIADAVADLAGGITVIAIAHHGALLDRADRIVHLEAGRVVG